MNWYKLAQRKTLDEMLRELESNPEVDRGVLQWLKELPPAQVGPVANLLIREPKSTREDLQKRVKGGQSVTEGQREEQAVTRYANIFKDHELVKGNRDAAAGMIRHAMKLASGHEEMLYVVEQYLNGTRKPSEDDMTIANELKKWRSGKTKGLIDKSRKINEFKTPEALGAFFRKIYGEETSAMEKASPKALGALKDLQRYYIGKVESEKFGPLSVYRFGKDNMGTEEEAERVRNSIGKLCFGVDYTWCILPHENGEQYFKVYSSGIGFFLYVNSEGRAAASIGFGDRGMVDPVNEVIEEEDIMEGTERLLKGSLLEGWRYIYGKQTSSEEKAMKTYEMFGDRYGMAVFLEPSRRVPMSLIWVIKNDLDEWADEIGYEEGMSADSEDGHSFLGALNAWKAKKAQVEDLDRIDGDIRLQRSISEKIYSGIDLNNVGLHELDWAKKTLDSGKAPQEWIDAISKDIAKEAYPPDFAFDWAKKTLESGKAPQEWMDAITKFIVKRGYPHGFAHKWAEKILESGKAPKEWMDEINKRILEDGDPPGFARKWVKKTLESGKAPQILVDAITGYIVKYGYPPNFAYEWAKKTLDSGKAPKAWIDAINRDIVKLGDPPTFAEYWAKKTLESGKAPQEWIDEINKFIVKRGYPPAFAEDWAKKTLESGKAPQEWIDRINRDIVGHGYPPNFAGEWAKKTLESGNAPQEWIDSINRDIVELGYPPGFAGEWAKKILESGKAPQEWMDAITKFIVKRGYPPKFAEDWAKKTLESGKAPKAWIDAMSKRVLLFHEDPPKFAEDWAKKTLESGKAPKELIDGINKRLLERGYPPGFADDWVKKTLESGKVPQEWMDRINRDIVKLGDPPRFAEYWAKKTLESGKAPQEWIDRINRDIVGHGYTHGFARDWAKKTLESGKAPQEWIDRINRDIVKYGYPPGFAYEWYLKNKRH